MKNYDYKSIILNQINKIFSKYSYKLSNSYTLRKIDKIDLIEKKIKFEKNSNIKYELSKKFVHDYPDNPRSHLALTRCMFDNFDTNWIDQANQYAKVRYSWIQEHELDNINNEFIGTETVVGSLGNHGTIESLINANKYKLRPKKNICLFLSKKQKLRNQSLFNYFKPHLNIIDDEKIILSLENINKYLSLPMGFLMPLEKKSIFYDFFPNLIKKRQYETSGYEPTFDLSSEDKQKGESLLKDMGIKNSNWYVTIHVRETGYRGETRKNTLDNFRNSNPLNYLKAIKYITDQGGWVIRMGDNSMTKLPKLPKVIDYAHSNFKSDFLDVFLAATSRFCIGTPSGYYTLADFFGVPILLTNLSWLSPYYTLAKKDLFIPRLIKKNNEIMNIDTLLENPYIFLNSDLDFKKYNVTSIENSEEDLLNATIEMMEKTSNKSKLETKTSLQEKFIKFTENKILNLTNETFLGFGNISSNYLEKHKKYLI